MVHVLLTNDDGPLNDEASPYIKSFVDEIESQTDWDLSIVLPHTQRSWIGKAHFANKDLTASFIYPTNDGNLFQGPFPTPQDSIKSKYKEWALVDGTPASCADIGINHLYKKEKGPVDFVISGPNFGRNTTAVYITSSGTVGAAMEASLSGKKAIGLSFGFESRVFDEEAVKEASKISVKLIQHLYNNWNDNVDIYTINIPLSKNLKYGETKIQYAPILENKWSSLFTEINQNAKVDSTIKANPEKADIVDGSDSNQIQFKWTPDFHAVHRSVHESEARGELNDGVVLDRGQISVTPLKAIFKDVPQITGEIKIDEISNTNGIAYLSIDPTSYIYPAILKALHTHLPNLRITNTKPEESSEVKVFQYGDYEELDFDRIMSDSSYLINSYIYRKALIRKHYLAHTIHSYVVKNPSSILIKAFPETFNLEVDYAEFLEDSLDEAYELRLEIEKNDRVWILKPSMSDKGQGIRIFKTIDQLQAIFDSFDEDPTDDEDDDEGEDDDNHGIITSQLRHFVVQEYISNPLLLSQYNNKKFHIRTYVLSSGSIEVFVYKKMLTLFALSQYNKPDDETDQDDEISMLGHLTNTCLQGEEDILQNNSVVEFWELEGLDDDGKLKIFNQICEIVGEVFKAAINVDKMNFQPLSNAFEIFGLDFIIDSDLNVTLLEINSYPDFKQTGDDLKSLIYGLFDSVIEKSVVPFFKNEHKNIKNELLVKVLDQSTENW